MLKFLPIAALLAGFVHAAPDAAGNGNYGFTDYEVSNGATYYYRVKEVGMDQTFSLSKVTSIKFKSAAAMNIYPTILENQTLNIDGLDNQELQLTLFDFLGRKVFSTQHVMNQIQLPMLGSGIYFASLTDKNEVLKTQKLFIK